jgi:hypothetical protein
MSRLAAILAAAAALALGGAAFGASPPPGATARCGDGSFSYSRHHSGTCSHHGGVTVWLSAGSTDTPVTSAARFGHTVLLGPRTRTGGCHAGTRPDVRCTPGAYVSGLTTAVLCAPGFHTSTIRNVPQSEKFAVEIEYGLAPRPYGRTIEIDHVVPLELGGSNDIANLFPETGGGAAGYHAKDRLEDQLHDLACAGSISLRVAQVGIARNWPALYRRVFETAP